MRGCHNNPELQPQPTMMDNENLKSSFSQQDDDACGKLWEIYSNEAKQYDEGLIQSWKDDMDNTLVFSGLYSAILTAFVIESYHNLQPDSTGSSTALLRRISEQIASPLNASNLTPLPDNSHFIPAPSVLACNILWFLSLALALICSFLATLVQQWSRRFLHRTSTVRSPGAHAHLQQFLYFGLKDLKMHLIVDLIPSLLHLSLFSFFAGLVAFLYDVNNILTWLFVAVISLVLFVYAVFTVVPIIKLGSPYATLLSPLLWRLGQYAKQLYYFTLGLICKLPRAASDVAGQPTPIDPLDLEEGLVLGICDEAEQKKPGINRPERDILDATLRASRKRDKYRESECIVWTLRSLNDDSELLPFVEAMPDVVLNGDSLREFNLHLLVPLIFTEDPQTNIILRTLSLIANAQSPWHTELHRTRCRTSGGKAIYALTRVLAENYPQSSLPPYKTSKFLNEVLSRVEDGISSNALDVAMARSAAMLCKYAILRFTLNVLRSHRVGEVPFSLIGELSGAAGYGMFSPDPETKTLSISQAEISIHKEISRQYLTYLEDAIDDYPTNFCEVGAVLFRNGISLSGNKIFEAACKYFQSLDAKNDPDPSNQRLDGILGGVIDLIISDSNPEKIDKSDKYAIMDCIWARVDKFGWGNTKPIWKHKRRLEKMLLCFQNIPIESFEYKEHMTSLQELLLHTDFYGDGSILTLWANLFYRLRSQKNEHPVPNPNPLPPLLISHMSLQSALAFNETAELAKVKSTTEQELLSDTELSMVHPIGPRWAHLVQCLNKRLSISHTRDFLQFFLRGGAYDLDEHGPRIPRNVGFVDLLVTHSEKFSALLMSEPEVSIELLDINAMLWHIWRVITFQSWGWEDPEEESGSIEPLLNAWSHVLPLLKLADAYLSEGFRKAVGDAIAKSTTRQRHTVVNEKLDLFTEVERFREIFVDTGFVPLLVPLPLNDSSERVDNI